MLETPFNRLAGFKTCYFLKKRLQHRCFTVNIAKFLRTLILIKICKQLLLPFLLFTVNISSSYLKKKIAEMVTRCDLLSLVVPFVVIRCTTRCHSLYHSLSLVAPLAVTRYITRLSFYKRSIENKNKVRTS